LSTKEQTEDKETAFAVGGRNLWILKPVGLNRGQGIHVVDSFKKCKKLIKEYCLGKEVVTGGQKPQSGQSKGGSRPEIESPERLIRGPSKGKHNKLKKTGTDQQSSSNILNMTYCGQKGSIRPDTEQAS